MSAGTDATIISIEEVIGDGVLLGERDEEEIEEIAKLERVLEILNEKAERLNLELNDGNDAKRVFEIEDELERTEEAVELCEEILDEAKIRFETRKG